MPTRRGRMTLTETPAGGGPGNHSGSPQHAGVWKKFTADLSRKEKVGYALFVLLLFGIFVILPGGQLAVQEWNKNTPVEWRECTVTEAEPRKVVGLKNTSYRIEIDTADCGDFELFKGVDENNYVALASSILPGSYRLELAASAVKLEQVERFFNSRVNIESIEPVSGELTG